LITPFYIPVLIASTGSNFEAEIAGITPETIPIIVDKTKPSSMFEYDSTNSKSPVVWETKVATIQTRTNPTKPPIIDKTIASNKN
jgi:hypothetical protein